MTRIERAIEYVLRGHHPSDIAEWLLEGEPEDTEKAKRYQQHIMMMRDKERQRYYGEMGKALATKPGKKSGVGKSGERLAAGGSKTVGTVKTPQAGREWTHEQPWRPGYNVGPYDPKSAGKSFSPQTSDVKFRFYKKDTPLYGKERDIEKEKNRYR